ncbi:MAG TPA: DinB family protein [Thermoanaerobaculia bacterium]|nr:DinB family protein [Thermoanaerobaculia bacterium]
MKNTTLLEEALEAWEDARNGVIEEARNIPERQFGFHPAPDTRTIAELLRHIMEVSMMMVEELTRSETDLASAGFADLLEPHARSLARLKTKRALLAALRSTLDEGSERLRQCGDLHMLQAMVRFDGQRGTRLTWMHHAISQEMYHRGQLATYQRLMKIEPALTKSIRQRS